MAAHPDLAAVAALIGEPARATMLVDLLDGRALTASELAARADVAPSTASEHLTRLVAGGLLACDAQGRHRYYRLADAGVARALESLGALARPTRPADRFEQELLQGLRLARTCYDHLAGRIGVAVADALTSRHLIEEDGSEYRVTPAGQAWFVALGVDVAAARRRRRAWARRCLDWSERRPHLAGALGAALLARLLELDWVERLDGERALRVTPAGRDGLLRRLDLQLDEGRRRPETCSRDR